MNFEEFERTMNTGSLSAFQIDWKQRIADLQNSTFQSLDEAITDLSNSLLNEVGLSQNGSQVEQTLHRLLTEDPVLKRFLAKALKLPLEAM